MNEFDDVSTERLTAIANGTIPADPGARRYARAVLWQRGIGTDPYATSATPAVSLPRVGDIPDPLDAAATPITPEPMAGGAPEFDSGIPLKTGVGFGRLPGRTQTIDGVEVPVYENAAGKQYYRLGDINAAQAAAREAERVRLQEESNARQEQQFGYMSDSPTPEQLANRVQSRAGARRQASTGAATRQRVERLADQLGVPYNVAYEAYEKALGEVSPSDSDMAGAGGGASVGAPVPGLGHGADALVGPDGLLTPRGIGHVMDAATRDLMANSGGVDRRAKQKAEARDIITRRAQLRNNPMEYLGRDDLNDWQRMVMARAMVGSSGQTPADFTADQDKRQLGWAQLQQQGIAQQAAAAEGLEKLRLEAERARQEGAIAQQRADTERQRVSNEAAALERGEQMKQEQRDEQQQLLERQRLAARYGPGVEDLLDGNFSTPAAEATLAKIALDSDDSWTGFYPSDAIRMDATLQSIGVTDPAVRQRLVQDYGLSPMQAFGPQGRSGPISGLYNFFYGDIDYPEYGPK